MHYVEFSLIIITFQFFFPLAYWGRDPSAAAANPLFGTPFGASLGMLPTGASNANDRFAMGHQQQQQQQVNIRNIRTQKENKIQWAKYEEPYKNCNAFDN